MAVPDFAKMNLSPEETKNMTRIMKDPKFMEMFVDYAKEISDPKHKEEMENALRQAESRGEKVLGFPEGKELLVPVAGFSAKTKDEDTNTKVFINICHSNKIKDCSGKDRYDKSGVDWDIPYSLAPPHKDKDKGGSECVVHDFVVGIKSHQLALESLRFKKFLVETAIDAVERQRKVKLCKEFTLPRLKYKGPSGEPKMMTISKDSSQVVPRRSDSHNEKAIKDDKLKCATNINRGPTSTPKPQSKSTTTNNSRETNSTSSKHGPHPPSPPITSSSEGRGVASGNENADGNEFGCSNPDPSGIGDYFQAESKAPADAAANVDGDHNQHQGSSTSWSPALENMNVGATTCTTAATHLGVQAHDQEVAPKYKVVYRNHLDLAQFWKDKANLQPTKDEVKEIVLHVHLPGVVELSHIELNVTKSEVTVLVRGKYKLKVPLKYEVDEENGHAKFDKEKLLYQLEVTLPLLKRSTHTHTDRDTTSLMM